MPPAVARRRTPRSGQFLLAGSATALVAVLGWLHRWTADDALISVRVSQNILSGHGPVFNAGERVEASTSVLWPWLLAAFAWLPWELTEVSVLLGIGLSAAAVWTGIRAAHRLHDADQTTSAAAIAPVGVLVVLATPAFWYYFSSGLETGLAFFWLSLAWTGLLAVAAQQRRSDVWTTFWLGLGPLVRPELAVVSLVLGAAVVWMTRSSTRRAVLVALLLAPGVGYEVFRAAYFGVLVPNPAIAKEAASASWGQGTWYLLDLVLIYHLWIPLLALAVLAVRWFPSAQVRQRVVVASPVVAGLLVGAYIVRTGGDFMHARLLLPSLFLVLLPLFVWPLSGRSVSIAAALVLAWTPVCALFLRLPYAGSQSHLIVDERSEWVAFTGSRFPVTVADHRRSTLALATTVDRAVARQHRVLIFRTSHEPVSGVAQMRSRGDLASPVVIASEVLGVAGLLAPKEVPVVDQRGLADPITSHFRLEGARGRPGHEKLQADAWLIARFGDPRATAPAWVAPVNVRSARVALRCPALADLRASYAEPLSLRRAWANLTGSIGRTRLRYSADPVMAQRELCG